MGSARHRQRRARARRRLRAQRSRGAARKPVSLVARLRGVHATATFSERPFRPNTPGPRMRLSTTTGFVKWKTEDSTDLDYSPFPLIMRDNAEEDFQFTQEVRLASDDVEEAFGRGRAKWQTGVFLFTQSYHQDAVNTLSPSAVRPCAGQSVLAGVRSGRLRPGRLRPGHGHVQGQARSRRRRARGLREQERGSEDVLRSGDRAADGRCGRRQLLARLAAVRGRLPAEAPSTTFTRQSRAASRLAGSTRRRRLAARPTGKKTPGTSKAA